MKHLDPNTKVEIVGDSIWDGNRITSFQITYPRIILAEVNTHRILSKNSRSSRAVPVRTILKEIMRGQGFKPREWVRNAKGMYNDVVFTRTWHLDLTWNLASKSAVFFAWLLMKFGVHKQLANRLTEPFQYTTTCITGTEWDNFFNLRTATDAQPQFQELAMKMKEEMDKSKPVERWYHLPYVELDQVNVRKGELTATILGDSNKQAWSLKELQTISSARIARTSYINHDGSPFNQVKDKKLGDWLIENKHLSPFDSVAISDKGVHRQFNGWRPWRVDIEKENDLKLSNLND